MTIVYDFLATSHRLRAGPNAKTKDDRTDKLIYEFEGTDDGSAVRPCQNFQKTFPRLTRFRISMSPRTHSNTLYNPRSLKRVKTFIVYIRSYILNIITFVRLTKQLVNKVTCVVKLFKLK